MEILKKIITFIKKAIMKKLSIALLFILFTLSTNAQSAEDYIYEGYTKGKSGDLYGAIKDYTKAIQINPNSFVAYNNRGLSKLKLKDFKGAIADYTKAIEIDPNKEISYSHRAMAKSALNDEYGAIADTNKAIELDPSKAVNYYGRGTSKYQLGDNNGACEDAKKAIELGMNASSASPLINRACKPTPPKINKGLKELPQDKNLASFTLKGIVVGKKTRLPGVTIINSNKNNSVTTDFDGNFEIKVEIGDEITFSFNGLKKFRKVITKKTQFNVQLLRRYTHEFYGDLGNRKISKFMLD